MEKTSNGCEQDPAMPPWLSIIHLGSYMKTPALVTALKAWLEIEQAGHGDGGQLVSWCHPAFVALDKRNQTVCGLLAYSNKSDEGDVHVHIGYVEPDYRRQSIYSHLWRALVVRAKKEKVRRIVGTTHADNVDMRRLALKLGRRQTALVQFELELWPSIFRKAD